jgi:hypothetical protein
MQIRGATDIRAVAIRAAGHRSYPHRWNLGEDSQMWTFVLIRAMMRPVVANIHMSAEALMACHG